MGLPVFVEATCICKSLGTQVTRLSICHLCFGRLLPDSFLMTVELKLQQLITFPFTDKGWLGLKETLQPVLAGFVGENNWVQMRGGKRVVCHWYEVPRESEDELAVS